MSDFSDMSYQQRCVAAYRALKELGIADAVGLTSNPVGWPKGKPRTENPEERRAMRREKQRQASMRRRRDKGVIPRLMYLAGRTSARQPWIEEGISRATWYRRKRRESK